VTPLAVTWYGFVNFWQNCYVTIQQAKAGLFSDLDQERATVLYELQVQVSGDCVQMFERVGASVPWLTNACLFRPWPANHTLHGCWYSGGQERYSALETSQLQRSRLERCAGSPPSRVADCCLLVLLAPVTTKTSGIFYWDIVYKCSLLDSSFNACDI